MKLLKKQHKKEKQKKGKLKSSSKTMRHNRAANRKYIKKFRDFQGNFEVYFQGISGAYE